MKVAVVVLHACEEVYTILDGKRIHANHLDGSRGHTPAPHLLQKVKCLGHRPLVIRSIVQSIVHCSFHLNSLLLV